MPRPNQNAGTLFETEADVEFMYDLAEYMHNIGAAGMLQYQIMKL